MSVFVCFPACSSCDISSLAVFCGLLTLSLSLKINRLKSGGITQDKPKYDAGFNIWNWVCQLPSCSSLINPAAKICDLSGDVLLVSLVY